MTLKKALESLDRLEYYHTMSVHDLGCKEQRLEDIKTIKRALLKTQEIYEIIKEKIRNCENHIERLHLEKSGRCSGKTGVIETAFAVKNQLMAYEDIKILIEISGVLEHDDSKRNEEEKERS